MDSRLRKPDSLPSGLWPSCSSASSRRPICPICPIGPIILIVERERIPAHTKIGCKFTTKIAHMQVFGCFLFVYMRFFYYLCPRFWSLEINYTLHPASFVHRTWYIVLPVSPRPVPPRPCPPLPPSSVHMDSRLRKPDSLPSGLQRRVGVGLRFQFLLSAQFVLFV